MAAPLGNKNSTFDKRLFANAVHRAAVQQDGKALRKIVDSLFVKGEQGDVAAIKEIADRLDGKAPQAITGEGGGPLVLQIVKFSDADDSHTGE